MKLRTRLIAVTAGLLLAGGGVAAVAAELPADTRSPSAQQLAAMSDGEITSDEYQAAFQRYQSCLAAEGYDILVDGENNATIDYSIPSAAVDSGVEGDCYDQEFRQVDVTWQVAREDSSRSAEFIRDCLIANGVAPGESLQGMVQQLREAGIDTTSCAEGN